MGSFCPAMTSLSRFSDEAAFSISISSSVVCFFSMVVFLVYYAHLCFSIVFISCPSLRDHP